jgi:hypothetical protein
VYLRTTESAGGLRYLDKKRWVEFINKGNSKNFYQVIKSFYKELINEWVSHDI